MTAQLGVEAVRAHPLARTVGVAGLVGTVVLFAGLIAGSPGEPPTDATTEAAAAFIRGLDVTWVRTAEVVADIGMFVLLWFMVGLALLLRRVEGDVPLRSTIAVLSSVLVAGFVIHGADPWQKKELAFTYLAMYVAILLLGPGRWSVDGRLRGKVG